MKIIALLPMKGHSERVPNKNLRSFSGVPLFHIILRKLIEVEVINEVIINTDSEEIARSAKSINGKVKIIERPKALQGDFVPMNEIINYDLANTDGDIYLQTHSTNPLLKKETIQNALNQYICNKDKYDSMFSVSKHQSRFYDAKLKAVNHNPQELLRTQDLPPLYEENSCFYIFTKESFAINENKRIGKNPNIYQMSKLESVDIDENEDFILAELIYKNFSEYR
ncbi:MAG: cytidylyltransferase domain-containing protein [Stygiobacter sp.]